MAKKKLSRRIEADKRARQRTRRRGRVAPNKVERVSGGFDYEAYATMLTLPTANLPLINDPSKVPHAIKMLDNGITAFQQDGKLLLPKFGPEGKLFVLSDYGGAHKQSAYETYSFLLLEPGIWIRKFKTSVREIRKRFEIPADIEICYKNLKHESVHRAIETFTRAAHQLFGIVFTLVVDKKLDSVIFTDEEGGVAGLHSALASYGIRMKPKPLERALRISFALSYLLKLVAPPNRKVVWITDRDAIVDNERFTDDLLRLLNFSSRQLEDHGRRVELFVQKEGGLLADVMAVPDLIAGATSLLLTQRDEGPGATVAKEGFEDILSLVHAQGISLRNLCFRIRAVNSESEAESTGGLGFLGEMIESTLKRPRGIKILI